MGKTLKLTRPKNKTMKAPVRTTSKYAGGKKVFKNKIKAKRRKQVLAKHNYSKKHKRH